MQKPTSNLLATIIKFVTDDSKIQKYLILRDKEKDLVCTELRCRFDQFHPSDKSLMAYRVDFIYQARYPNLEPRDDLAVLVEVKDGNPSDIRVIRGKEY